MYNLHAQSAQFRFKKVFLALFSLLHRNVEEKHDKRTRNGKNEKLVRQKQFRMYILMKRDMDDGY